ncbi:MAG: Calx-beta domain-containing protein, partial [Planctomycetota bacterium]
MKGSGKIVLGALGLLGASCSGGGGGGEVDERPALSFETGAQSVSESAGSVDLVVTLTAVAGPLAADLEIEVIDRGTGTAGAGEDYGALPTTVLTFPDGSETGETRTAAVSLLGDSIAEGADETIVFGLAPTPDAQLGSATQTVTLEDAHVATVSFQSATSVTPDESSSNHSVLVELDVTNGGSLGFDLDVDVQDEGTGSATAGSDYTALGSVSVTFTSGTADGATRTVDVGVLDDGDAEGTETLALELERHVPESGERHSVQPRDVRRFEARQRARVEARLDAGTRGRVPGRRARDAGEGRREVELDRCGRRGGGSERARVDLDQEVLGVRARQHGRAQSHGRAAVVLHADVGSRVRARVVDGEPEVERVAARAGRLGPRRAARHRDDAARRELVVNDSGPNTGPYVRV